MKKILLSIIAVLICFGAFAKKPKAAEYKEERPIAYFDSFKAYGPLDVFFVQGDECKVILEGKEDIVNKLMTEIDEKTLSIRLQDGIYKRIKVKITVCAPELSKARTFGSGDITCGVIDMPEGNIKFETNGSGDVKLNSITCNNLILKTNGSGNILSGNISCKKMALETNGSGDIKVKDVESTDVTLDAVGSGHIVVKGECQNVEASTQGSGKIKGNLKYSTIKKRKYGSGRIKLVEKNEK